MIQPFSSDAGDYSSARPNRTVLLVLNYKKYSDAIYFLQSVLEHDVRDADIVMLDNGSQNESVAALKEWLVANFPSNGSHLVKANFQLQGERFAPHLRVEHIQGRVALFSSDVNYGFSGGNNALGQIGSQLGYEFLYFLNSDILFTDKFTVTKLEQLHDRVPDAYISGPCVINQDGTFDSPFRRDTFWGDAFYYGPLNRLRRALGLPVTQFAIEALSKPKGAQVYKISGAAMFIPTRRFLELDGFDEHVWLSSEEAILGEKVLASGGKVMYLPTTVIIHVKASAPRESRRAVDILRNHFKQRNYYYRAYRGYGRARMTVLGVGQRLRLLLAKRHH
jgi:GT2 family glycosyltransferase